MRKLLMLAMATALLVTLAPGTTHGRWRYGNSVAARMHGFAHIIRNEGRAERAFSEARINNEEARSRFIDNQKKWTQTYFEKKEINAAYVGKQRAEERAATQKYLKYKPSAAPRPLSLSQFDPTSGEITWPDGLQTPDFDALRKPVNELFGLRSRGLATPGIAFEMHTAIESVRAELKQQIDKITPVEYIAARKFLDQLTNEADYPSE